MAYMYGDATDPATEANALLRRDFSQAALTPQTQGLKKQYTNSQGTNFDWYYGGDKDYSKDPGYVWHEPTQGYYQTADYDRLFGSGAVMGQTMTYGDDPANSGVSGWENRDPNQFMYAPTNPNDPRLAGMLSSTSGSPYAGGNYSAMNPTQQRNMQLYMGMHPEMYQGDDALHGFFKNQVPDLIKAGVLAGGGYVLGGAAGLLGGGTGAAGAGVEAGLPGMFGEGVSMGGTGAAAGSGDTGLTLGGSGTAAAGMGGGTGLTLGGGTAGAGTVAGTVAGTGAASGLSGLLSGLPDGALKTGLGMAGSYLNSNAAQDAAKTQADAQIRAAQIAADAAKFRPVGVTTNFGSSNFGYDANGNLTSAGYTLNPQLQAQQNQIMGASGGLLNQYTGAQAATAGMDTAAQRAMTLGNQYLATDPQAQAAKYLADQQGLLAPGRAQDFAALQAQNAAQGRSGFAMGGGVNGQMAANPEMQAYWNARMQQDAQLAANATQGGMDYAKFGLGTVGSGGDLLSSMYKTQTNAASPYTTALGTANTIEGMGQNAMDLGTSIGAKSSTGAAQAGMLTANGMTNAAATMAPSNAYSPWGALLTGGANALQQYKFGA